MRTFSLSRSFIEQEEEAPKKLGWWTATVLFAVAIISGFAFDELPNKAIASVLTLLLITPFGYAKLKRDIARYRSGWHDVSIGEQSVILPGAVEVPFSMITSIEGNKPTTEHPFGMILVEYDTGLKWAGLIKRTGSASMQSDRYEDFESLYDAFESVRPISPNMFSNA